MTDRDPNGIGRQVVEREKRRLAYRRKEADLVVEVSDVEPRNPPPTSVSVRPLHQNHGRNFAAELWRSRQAAREAAIAKLSADERAKYARLQADVKKAVRAVARFEKSAGIERL